MHKIRKDDLVKVIAGKDKDKTAVWISCVWFCMLCNHVAALNQNFTVLNAKNFTGLIFIFSCNNLYKVIFSNFMLVVDGKATKVGFEVKDGKKVRVAKATGKVID